MGRQRKKPQTRAFSTSWTLIKLGLMTVVPLLLFAVSYLGFGALAQVIQRPFHLLAHLSHHPALGPNKTWEHYGELIKRYQSRDLPPEFLAAMVQSLSEGVAWTPTMWSLDLRRKPWDLFRPTHDEFGLLAFKKAYFKTARQYCLIGGQSAVSKPVYQLGGCWWAGFKTRGSAADSLEVASAYLQHVINTEITENHILASSGQVQKFALVTHLCGHSTALHFLEHKFKLRDLHSCYGRELSPFFATFARHRRTFQTLIAQDSSDSTALRQLAAH